MRVVTEEGNKLILQLLIASKTIEPTDKKCIKNFATILY